MKMFIPALLLLWSLFAQASGALLIPVHTPKPLYPKELVAESVSGKVRVGYVVHSDGSVTNVKILESSHPQFSEAVELALSTWRYKPWQVTEDRLPQLEVIAPMDFALRSPGMMPDDINTQLLSLSCKELNQAISVRDQNYPDQPLSYMDIFWDTSGYLQGKYMRAHLNDSQRKVLLDELEAAQPQIVESCRIKPEAKYADYLPVRLRELM